MLGIERSGRDGVSGLHGTDLRQTGDRVPQELDPGVFQVTHEPDRACAPLDIHGPLDLRVDSRGIPVTESTDLGNRESGVRILAERGKKVVSVPTPGRHDKGVARTRGAPPMQQQRVASPDLVRLFDAGTVASLSEWELLERFTTRGDEFAFEALVARLGPMVLGTCRRMLAASRRRGRRVPGDVPGPPPEGPVARPGGRHRRHGSTAWPSASPREPGPTPPGAVGASGSASRSSRPGLPRRSAIRRSAGSSTRRSTGSRPSTRPRSSSATSRAGRTRRPPGSSPGRSAASRGGSPAPGRCSNRD